MQVPPTPIAARALVHQEGVLALVALGGLMLREEGPLPLLAPTSPLLVGMAIGSAVGLGCSALLYLVRFVPAIRTLETWQRVVVGHWSPADAISVAVISGVAEEALLRALLQPLIGLLPAAMIFAALHLIPDLRLWFWPVLALTAGVAFGLLFEQHGYPAAAAAHMTLNGISLARLRRGGGEHAGGAS